ncbi:MAG: hypothetical protein ACREI7_14790, partial [Myxococcota bacterium]
MLRNAIVAVALGVLGATLALVLQRDVGVARDEAVYMHHGSRYADWWLDAIGGDPTPIERTWGGKDATANN